MIKKYKITVNDEEFMVSIEPIPVSTPVVNGAPHVPGPAPRVSGKPAAAQTKPVVPQTRPSAPAPKSKPVSSDHGTKTEKSGSGRTVAAPLPGNMWKVFAKSGQTVKKGDVLFIIEAMKMENEIFAPCDGTIQNVMVNEGVPVNTGDPLCSIA